MALSPLNQRRWNNFKRNRRAFWSLIIFCVAFGVSLFAEFIANDRPILINYKGEFYTPIFNFYPETTFGGDFKTEAVYNDPVVECLIASGGIEDCFDVPEDMLEQIDAGTFEHAEFEKGGAGGARTRAAPRAARGVAGRLYPALGAGARLTFAAMQKDTAGPWAGGFVL